MCCLPPTSIIGHRLAKGLNQLVIMRTHDSISSRLLSRPQSLGHRWLVKPNPLTCDTLAIALRPSLWFPPQCIYACLRDPEQPKP